MRTIVKYYWFVFISVFTLSLSAKAQNSTSGKKQLDTEMKNEQKREKQRRSNAKAGENAQEKGSEKPKYQAVTKKKRFSLKRKSDKNENKKEFE
jgi:hypothetical protein